MGWTGVVTDAGKNAIEQYLAGSATLNINLVKTGKGTRATAAAMRAATDLADPVTTGSITDVKYLSTGTKFRLSVGSYTTTYTLKEVGLFATVGTSGGGSSQVMLALMQADDGGMAIPNSADFPDFAFILTLLLAITNSDDLTVTIDPDAYVSHTEFLEAVGDLQEQMASIYDIVYPVGSIYISVNNVNPETVFTGTTWEQIKDKFLLAAGDVYSGGATGGQASVTYTPGGTVGSHTLTTAEIPSHNHEVEITKDTGDNDVSHTHSIPALSGSTNEKGSHKHSLAWSGVNWGFSVEEVYKTQGLSVVCMSGNWNIMNNSGEHSHNVTTTANTSGNNSAAHKHSVTVDGYTKSTGGGQGHSHSFTGTAATINTMPPYLAVYMWKRTA